ncbi:Mammalian cell entry related domain protein [Gluconacetobacter diazotrophicus PA1 5]|uniref:Paraquat-inducible protein B n=2 Tax=Gluconacetobacter diazotrophicus TaxID=33996 RepID=A9HAR9_GLUDA|nr:MlaD family protein [Gluconacetobacter diazotrophicus]ACI51013.1 Mammalian cell entry related domain protein [Gluconacetobacter diazotrophicus PA1 5]MBB2156712.1 MCE family protein [Gluconacetobacter diazotrophicus]TWB08532.1 paraquat-inducible protein B [Gluconacetobacter diazotrophicus]CAP54729.1 Paraquat-inducible protein B [Gluconacetobacter diazotrophicus PA1 5]
MANKETAVGAFVIGGVALGMAALVFFGNFNIFSSTKQAVVVFQGSTSGLSIGAPVTFRGVRVGAVDGISITYDARTHGAYIPVTIEVQPGRVTLTGEDHRRTALTLRDLIDHGLRASLNLQSFVTGQAEIDLDFDPASPAVLHPDIATRTEIPTRQSAIQKVQETLSQLPLKDLADNAQAALQSIRQLAERLDGDLPPLVDSVRETSDHSRAAVDTATRAIDDLQRRLDTTLGSIDTLATTGTRQLDARGADLHVLLGNANDTVIQARQSLAGLRDMTSPRSADRANIDSTLRDLSAAAAALRGFASDVERNPQLLLMGRRP